jgi:Cu(I)/Ag(I) efflux system membrane fusion protein
MNRVVAMGMAAAICAAAGTAFYAGAIPRVSSAGTADSDAAIYYQDPDGKPFYSLTPKKTPDGRAWRAMPAGADVSFDEPK